MTGSRGLARALAVVAAVTLLTGAMRGVVQGRCDWNTTERMAASTHSTSDDRTDNRTTITLSRGRCGLEVRIRGDVTLADDERDVTAIRGDGSFVLEEDDGDVTRRVEIRATGGALLRRWLVDGREQAYGEAAQRFLADRLPVLLRRTGWNAEARVRRILERDGVDGVLREIPGLSSDYVKRIYLRAVADSGRLSPAQVTRVAQLAGREISSDYELAQVLLALAARYPVTDAQRAVFAEAAASLSSDYERRRVLSAAFGTARVNDAAAVALLRAARQINSDYELATLLIQFMEGNDLGEAVRPAFFEAVGTVNSGYERRRVLTAVTERREVSRAVLEAVLQAVPAISSDYERAQVLVQLAERHQVTGNLRDLYLRAAESLRSAYERQRAMRAIGVVRGEL